MFFLAGDHVKFGFPMASMTTQLAWGAVTFKDGYEKAGEIQHMKECLKWATDYFIAAHKSDFELIAQVRKLQNFFLYFDGGSKQVSSDFTAEIALRHCSLDGSKILAHAWNFITRCPS